MDSRLRGNDSFSSDMICSAFISAHLLITVSFGKSAYIYIGTEEAEDIALCYTIQIDKNEVLSKHLEHTQVI